MYRWFVHGTEVCVGLYIFSKLENVLSDYGLCKNDGLRVLAKPVVYNNTRKDVYKKITKQGFKVILGLGNKMTKFPDVTLSKYL